MSDAKEPSYYEIALTNRQVMTVFVILLTCVVAAFFSGVWVGRRDPALAAATLVADHPEEEADSATEALGELNFFSDGERQTPPPVTEQSPPVRATPPPPSEPSAAAPPAQPTVSDPAPGSPIVVQVFSSNDRGQAERVVDRLRSAGFAALLSPVEVRDQTMYRVRIGPFRERDEAEKVADRVRRDFKLDTWITSG